MVRRVIVMMLIGLLTTTGCTVSFNGDTDNGHETPHATAPTDDDGVEEWDLRTPPSAAEVGLRSDKDYVGFETRKPRRVRFLLPEDRELTVDAVLVVFDRVMYKDPADPTRPTGMDFRMRSIPLDTAYEVMGESLEAFGLDTSAVDEWRNKIETRPTSGPSADRRIEGGGNTTIGYLNIGVGGVYDPVDGDESVTIKWHVNLYEK